MIARCEGVTYTYPAGDEPALRHIGAEIPEGALVLLAGASASGKSTFLRLLNGLVPQFHGGRLGGRVEVARLDPARTPTRRMAQLAGMVFQEPESQAIADTVEDEIAFSMEQHGVARPEMQRRMEELLASLGVAALRHRRLSTLSGGERQRVAIAAVMALKPRLLLLDEPTSQLDPAGADAVIAAVRRLQADQGIALAVAEHRLERLLPLADGVIAFERGSVRSLAPREAGATLAGAPAVSRLGQVLGLSPVPLTVEEARTALRGRVPGIRVANGGWPPSPGDELLAVDGLSVAYGNVPALRDVALTLREGELVALMGANGSGKSTLLRAITGLVTADEGHVAMRGDPAPVSIRERTAIAALVPQDPAIALYRETVEDEMAETFRNRGLPCKDGARVRDGLDRWDIGHLARRNPRDLSVGQQQRVAIAAMLGHEPAVWLLDEPTRGADVPAKAWLAQRLREHAGKGGAALVATHDIEAAAGFATRVIGLDSGQIVYDLPARQAFSAGGPVPTQVARVVAGALTPEEVVW